MENWNERTAAAEPGSPEPPERLALTVVDDEREIADYLGGLLREALAELAQVQVFHSGARALESLKSGPCDLLVTDIRMPVTSGLDLLEYVVERRLPTEVLFLTAYRDFDCLYNALQKKPITFLVKTEQESVIIRTVREILLGLRRKRREEHRASEVLQLLEGVENIAANAGRIRSMEQAGPASPDAPAADDKRLGQLKRYIRENVGGDLSLPTLARQVHYHPAYLSKAFHEAFGMRISTYILCCRMDAAKQYLTETEQPVSDISESLGYQSPQTFIRSFKKETGMTPMEWRRIYASSL